jgi:hypothetical protein
VSPPPPPHLLNIIFNYHWNPHKITIRTGGQVPSEHYTNRNNHIFTQCLAKDSKFHIQNSSHLFHISWTLRNSQQVNLSETLLVFKRFRVQNFFWIRRVDIFILNFSVGFYSHAHTLRNNWPIRSSCGRDDVKLTRVGEIWPLQSISGICRVTRYKRRIVLPFLLPKAAHYS